MPRKAASVEYLNRLIEWAGGRPIFRQLTGITAGNLHAYENGGKTITWKRLRRCNEQIFGVAPAFIPIIEGYDFKSDGAPSAAELPAVPGIYGFFDSARRIIYYGKATNLYAEVRQTLNRHAKAVKSFTGARNLRFRDLTYYVSAYRIARGDADFRHDVEALCHKLFVNNTYNRNSGNFTRSA
jgi:hypothetical protein